MARSIRWETPKSNFQNWQSDRQEPIASADSQWREATSCRKYRRMSIRALRLSGVAVSTVLLAKSAGGTLELRTVRENKFCDHRGVGAGLCLHRRGRSGDGVHAQRSAARRHHRLDRRSLWRVSLHRLVPEAGVATLIGNGGPCRDRTYDQLIKRSLHGYRLNL